MYNLKENYIIKNIEEGILLIDIKDTKNIYQFNSIGAYIIQNISKPKQDIIKELTTKYKIEEQQVSKDYQDFINILLGNDIIKVK